MSINQWAGVESAAADGCILRADAAANSANSTGADCLRADEFLQSYSFSRENFVVDLLFLVACIVVFYAIGFVGLLIRVRLSR